MAIAVTLLGRVDFARFAYIYFLAEMVMMLGAVAWFRRLRPLGGTPIGRSADSAFMGDSKQHREVHHLL